MIKKSLAETNPEIIKEWYPTKNGNLTTYDIKRSSKKYVWWKCPKGDDHEWLARPHRVYTNSGCPICIDYEVVKSTCLATTHPRLFYS